MKNVSLLSILRKIDRDEEGAVSLETILIIGAIALPILIFLINVAWPKVKDYYNKNIETLQSDADNASS
jgi:hypothetical protein